MPQSSHPLLGVMLLLLVMTEDQNTNLFHFRALPFSKVTLSFVGTVFYPLHNLWSVLYIINPTSQSLIYDLTASKHDKKYVDYARK